MWAVLCAGRYNWDVPRTCQDCVLPALVGTPPALSPLFLPFLRPPDPSLSVPAGASDSRDYPPAYRRCGPRVPLPAVGGGPAQATVPAQPHPPPV